MIRQGYPDSTRSACYCIHANDWCQMALSVIGHDICYFDTYVRFTLARRFSDPKSVVSL
jgi:hypothetical protein